MPADAEQEQSDQVEQRRRARAATGWRRGASRRPSRHRRFARARRRAIAIEPRKMTGVGIADEAPSRPCLVRGTWLVLSRTCSRSSLGRRGAECAPDRTRATRAWRRRDRARGGLLPWARNSPSRPSPKNWAPRTTSEDRQHQQRPGADLVVLNNSLEGQEEADQDADRGPRSAPAARRGASAAAGTRSGRRPSAGRGSP